MNHGHQHLPRAPELRIRRRVLGAGVAQLLPIALDLRLGRGQRREVADDGEEVEAPPAVRLHVVSRAVRVERRHLGQLLREAAGLASILARILA